MDSHYQTVFELGIKSFPWAAALHPLPFIFGGIALMYFGRKKQSYQIAGAVITALATVIMFVSGMVLIPEFMKLKASYKQGDGGIVEGVVENFRPAPPLGPAKESFSVKGVLFSYNALDATPCFHNAPLHRGPIRAGIRVRIYYKNQCIQRVDVLK